MKIKTHELTGRALDWAVATADGRTISYDTVSYWVADERGHGVIGWQHRSGYSPSTQGGDAHPIIDRENISVIRCEDEYGVDDDGYTTDERIPVWGAVVGKRLSAETVYGSQGDNWGESYSIDEDEVVYGPTSLVAAMRAFVLKKLGASVDVPGELLK